MATSKRTLTNVLNLTTNATQHPLSPASIQSSPPPLSSATLTEPRHQTKSYFDLKADSQHILAHSTSPSLLSSSPTPSNSQDQPSSSPGLALEPHRNKKPHILQPDPSSMLQSLAPHNYPKPSTNDTYVLADHLQGPAHLNTQSAHNTCSSELTACAIKTDQDRSKRRKGKMPTPSTNKGKSPDRLHISLSKEPHRMQTNHQLLSELSNAIDQPRSQSSNSRPPSPSSSHLVDHRIMSELMLTIIKELSSRLQQTKRELANSQVETRALRSLLVDSYSVGLGEIERCLVRSRVHAANPTSADASASSSPWAIDVPPNWNEINTIKSGLEDDSHPQSSHDRLNGLSDTLDLDDLREAMSDNPCYDTASLSSGQSRSILASPGSLASLAGLSKCGPRSQTKAKAHSVSSRLFNPGIGRSSKATKSTPSSVSPLLPPPAMIDGKHVKQPRLLLNNPTVNTKLHRRKDSVGSSRSGVSSQYNFSGVSAGGSWGFNGWRWSNPPNRLVTKDASTCGTDGEDDGDCASQRQHHPPTDHSDSLEVEAEAPKPGLDGGIQAEEGQGLCSSQTGVASASLPALPLSKLSAKQALNAQISKEGTSNRFFAHFFESVARRLVVSPEFSPLLQSYGLSKPSGLRADWSEYVNFFQEVC